MTTPLHGVIVLLVDDSEDVRHFLSLALHEAGAIAITAGTAGGAVGILDALTCHVVVTDRNLPDQDEDWLLNEVRKRRARLGPIPVIALTGDTPSPQRRNPGFARYLVKPLTAAAAVEAIASVLPGEPS